MNYSICPAGWTLPTGGIGGQFQSLYTQYNSATAMLVNPTSATDNNPTVGQITNTPGFLLSGFYRTIGAADLNRQGFYWSRTAATSGSGHAMWLNGSGVGPTDGNPKYFGFAIRCLVQQ